MKENELIYLLALQGAEGIGEITARRLLMHCGSARTVFQERDASLMRIEGVGPKMVAALRDRSLFSKAERELDFIQQEGVKCTAYSDPDFPLALSQCADAPLLFFRKGSMDLGVSRVISVVGTRKATSYGLQSCEELIAALAPYNPLIVSGLAYGIDICAHKTAMACRLQTVACLAHGLRHVYPARHRSYAENMMAHGGVITDFWSDQEPERNNFLRRNRLIAGLSQATIVIESGESGGSLVTADIAFSYNREVFAVPGRISDVMSKGCNHLIRSQCAQVLTSAADLVNALGWEEEQKPQVKAVQKQLFQELSQEEARIYEYLQCAGQKPLDELALEQQLPVQQMSVLLFNLEMKGMVLPLPGKVYEAI